MDLMFLWMASMAGLAIAYLLGSTPTGYLAGKLLKGIDIRQHGSRSTGATNVLRTLGKGPALAVLLVDARYGIVTQTRLALHQRHQNGGGLGRVEDG
eukprot:gene54945-75292_t